MAIAEAAKCTSYTAASSTSFMDIMDECIQSIDKMLDFTHVGWQARTHTHGMQAYAKYARYAHRCRLPPPPPSISYAERHRVRGREK